MSRGHRTDHQHAKLQRPACLASLSKKKISAAEKRAAQENDRLGGRPKRKGE